MYVHRRPNRSVTRIAIGLNTIIWTALVPELGISVISMSPDVHYLSITNLTGLQVQSMSIIHDHFCTSSLTHPRSIQKCPFAALASRPSSMNTGHLAHHRARSSTVSTGTDTHRLPSCSFPAVDHTGPKGTAPSTVPYYRVYTYVATGLTKDHIFVLGNLKVSPQAISPYLMAQLLRLVPLEALRHLNLYYP